MPQSNSSYVFPSPVSKGLLSRFTACRIFMRLKSLIDETPRRIQRCRKRVKGWKPLQGVRQNPTVFIIPYPAEFFKLISENGCDQPNCRKNADNICQQRTGQRIPRFAHTDRKKIQAHGIKYRFRAAHHDRCGAPQKRIRTEIRKNIRQKPRCRRG